MIYLLKIAFYVIYGYGRPPVSEIFSSPFQSYIDVLLMSLHDLEIAYNNLIITQYPVVGRVII